MFLAAALLVCTAFAVAQGGQGGGQGRGQGGFGAGQRGGMGFGAQSETQLAFRADVQKDLGVTTEQKTKLDELQAKQRQGRGGQGGQGQGGVRGGGQGQGQRQGQGQGGGQNRGQGGGQRQGGGFGQMTEEQRQAMQQRQEEARKELATILNESQMKRIGEIRVQLAGTRAVMQPDVQKTLNITTEQITKISDLQAKQGEANRALFQNQDLSQEDRRTRMENNNKILDAEILKVLTADQNAKLKALGGKPFKADPQPTGGRRGGL